MAPALASLTDLTAPVSESNPSGDDVAYDADYLEMEQLAHGRDEQQFGEVIVDAVEPPWRELTTAAFQLAVRSHDLRVGIALAQGLLHTEGLRGFASGLEVLASWLTNEWDTLYPALDPADGDEAIERSNIVLGLCDPKRTIAALKSTPLATAAGLGTCCLCDLRHTHDDACDDAPRLGPHEVHAIFIAAKRSDLRTLLDDLSRTRAALQSLLATFNDRTGFAPNLSTTEKTIDEIERAVVEMMPDGIRESPTPNKDNPVEKVAMPVSETLFDAGADIDGTDAALTSPEVSHGGGPFEVRSRTDVITALDAVCRYYAEHEPSSPVPLLIQRTQSLVTMDFIDIMRNLSPDSLGDLARWVGAD